MTVGEKIKQYRKLRKLTQKGLAEKAGLSEISIRKYEAGDRIPKQEQLRKLALALEVADNYLYDVRLDRMSIDTVGDFMTLIFLLEEKAGLEFQCQYSDDKTADPDSISITFENKNVKGALAKLLSERNLVKDRNYYVNHLIDPPFEPEELDRLNTMDSALLEVEQTKLTESRVPLAEEEGD
ncbi:MAG: helix-turn-helix transcriptional regulator [Eubacteriales bacterium]